jgi:signal transduction histidine kinase
MITSCQIFLNEFAENGITTIAYYSHLIPVFIAVFLSLFTLIKTRTKLAWVFFLFSASFSLWLLGDLVLWTSPNYSWIYFAWSWLDYTNIVFFVFGAYFFITLANGKLTNSEKLLLATICIPPFILTVLGGSVLQFNQPACEVFESDKLTMYKLMAESTTVLVMLFSFFKNWKVWNKSQRNKIILVLCAILAFFAVFSATEYVATITDVYEINLYGLFILPVFLIAMVFAISNLEIFNLRHLGTQLLVYVLIIMTGSQFLFLQGSTDKALNIITLSLTIVFAYFLLKVAKRETEQRDKIEKLATQLTITNEQLSHANERLHDLDIQKTEFLSIASHQLRAPLTAIKGYSSLILEGSFGEVTEKVKGAVDVVFQSSQKLVTVIEDFLNITRIELGKMKYEMGPMNMRQLVEMVLKEQKNMVAGKGLQLAFEAEEGKDYQITGDSGKLSQVITNLIDNAAKYTKQGGIKVSLTRTAANKVRLTVKDTGVGLTPETISHLFEKFSRAKDAGKVNIVGTGLGLYVAKQIVEGHQGKIWAESEGEGKGSSFIVEI